jgi:hypothetical protein
MNQYKPRNASDERGTFDVPTSGVRSAPKGFRSWMFINCPFDVHRIVEPLGSIVGCHERRPEEGAIV